MFKTSFAVLTILALRRFRLIGLTATLAAAVGMPGATFLRAADPPPSPQQATALRDALAAAAWIGLKSSPKQDAPRPNLSEPGGPRRIYRRWMREANCSSFSSVASGHDFGEQDWSI
jgi:hypothetical protein